MRPASAGMSLDCDTRGFDPAGAPRVSGDEPAATTAAIAITTVRPASAGMSQTAIVLSALEDACAPRQRG